MQRTRDFVPHQLYDVHAHDCTAYLLRRNMMHKKWSLIYFKSAPTYSSMARTVVYIITAGQPWHTRPVIYCAHFLHASQNCGVYNHGRATLAYTTDHVLCVFSLYIAERIGPMARTVVYIIAAGQPWHKRPIIYCARFLHASQNCGV